jgi:hypothetical protein
MVDQKIKTRKDEFHESLNPFIRVKIEIRDSRNSSRAQFLQGWRKKE